MRKRGRLHSAAVMLPVVDQLFRYVIQIFLGGDDGWNVHPFGVRSAYIHPQGNRVMISSLQAVTIFTLI
jgi:hypothetical protein